MGAYADRIRGLADDGTPEGRRIARYAQRRLRALAHANGDPWVGRSITRGQYTVTVTAGPEYVEVAGDDGLLPQIRLVLRIERNGVDVTPPDFNPWFIQAPPILVPDPAGDVVIEGRGTFREDPPAALRAVILDQLRRMLG